eukprot:g11326.t1
MHVQQTGSRVFCLCKDCSSGQTCSSWSINVLTQDEARTHGCELCVPSDWRQAPIGSEPFDSQVLPSPDNFALLHGSPGRPIANWRTRYTLGCELEAFSLARSQNDGRRPWHHQHAGLGRDRSPSVRNGGRKVALKRFNQRGTVMFKNELKALVAAGVHPHIVRLLESFEGGSQEDVMVLEYCSGGDIYELYASSNGCCMLEAFVLALQHLVACGIEHRDVKPENLLLYGVSDATQNEQVPLIKLADFGWAAIVENGGPPPSIPPEGVGSLWYAPPELNPPVRGAEIVMRLAAHGQLNMTTKAWNTELSQFAKDFILALIKPDPAKRLGPSDALQHAFIAASSAQFPELAAQLVCVASSSIVLTSQASWSDVLYLAFLYLDVDCDGFLGADDLSVHLPGAYRIREISQACISKWRTRPQVLSMGASNFLTYTDFRQAVIAATAPSVCVSQEHSPDMPKASKESDEQLEERMDAIEEACRKFASEGFEEEIPGEMKI